MSYCPFYSSFHETAHQDETIVRERGHSKKLMWGHYCYLNNWYCDGSVTGGILIRYKII